MSKKAPTGPDAVARRMLGEQPHSLYALLLAPFARELEKQAERHAAADAATLKECQAILREARKLNTQNQIVAMIEKRQASARRRVNVWSRLGVDHETKTGDPKAARTRRR